MLADGIARAPASLQGQQPPLQLLRTPSRRAVSCSRMSQTVPAASQRRIIFTNNRQQKLVGVLTNPAENGGNQQATKSVVLCHGYGSSKEGFHFRAIADALAAAGLASLRFDFTGNGESEGIFKFGGYWDEVEDIRAAVVFLREEQHIDPFAIVGHSKGGTDVILYSQKYDGDPAVIINVCGRFDLASGITARFGEDIYDRLKWEPAITMPHPNNNGPDWRLTDEDMQERLNTDVAAAARGIVKSHILTLHGTADRTIPLADGHAVMDAMRKGRASIQVFDGADHGFSQHGPELVAAVVEHVLTQLQARS